MLGNSGGTSSLAELFLVMRLDQEVEALLLALEEHLAKDNMLTLSACTCSNKAS